MRLPRKSLFGVLCCLLVFAACQQPIPTKNAQSLKKETEVFAIEGTDTLRLDRYVCMEKTDTKQGSVK